MNACDTTALVVKGDKLGSDQYPRNQYVIERMKLVPYSSTVVSIMYAQIWTQPNLAFITGMSGRYQKNPAIEH
jgi:hypothetical protein